MKTLNWIGGAIVYLVGILMVTGGINLLVTTAGNQLAQAGGAILFIAGGVVQLVGMVITTKR